jgi:hypothetical protein
LRFVDPSPPSGWKRTSKRPIIRHTKKPRLAAGASYREIMTPLHYFDAGADGPSGVDMLECKGPEAGSFGRGEATTRAFIRGYDARL